jgi:hypothetical protein
MQIPVLPKKKKKTNYKSEDAESLTQAHKQKSCEESMQSQIFGNK